MVSYTYDFWGKHDGKAELKDENGNIVQQGDIKGTLASTVGVKNPYRYRGYRFDMETGLYYLNSRYYNSEWGRFINADIVIGTAGELLSFNMFAYCSNNPVNRNDPDGQSWGALLAGVGALFAIPAEVAAVITVAVVALAVVTVVAIVDVAIQEYRNNHIDYATSSSSGSSQAADGTGAGTTGKSTKPTVNVKGRSKWKAKPFPKGLSVGKKKLPSSDMVKKPIIDSNGKQVGEMHYGQPEYNYNPNGTKTPTGRVYPDHYHIKGDPMHYIP